MDKKKQIPPEVIQAAKIFLEQYDAEVVYLGQYDGADVYTCDFKEPVYIGYPTLYLFENSKVTEIDGTVALHILGVIS